MSARPTIVLVHGAFADASGFSGLLDRLESDGYPAIAPPNPLRSLSTDAAALQTRVAAVDGPVILIGHCYGGAVIGQAAAGLTNVVGLIYLAAFGLEIGESCLSVQDGYPVSLLATESSPTSYDAPGAPGGPDLYVNESAFREVLCADSSPATSRQLYATQRPLSAFAFTEAATARGWDSVPSWYLVSEKDNAIPVELQRAMAERMGAHTESIYASHTAFIAHPHNVGRFLRRAVEDLSSRVRA